MQHKGDDQCEQEIVELKLSYKAFSRGWKLNGTSMAG